MKSKLLLVIVTAIALFAFPKVNNGQVINLGSDASKFVLYTSSGAVGDNASAHSHITGDVGTLTPGPINGFGNVDGLMHPGTDPAAAACEIDLQATIAQINSNPATLVGPLSLGSGAVLTPGIYSIPGNATLTLDLILDGQGDPNAEFVLKIAGTFATNTNSKVKLINGALACHVYWKIDGAVTMASLSTMRGNIISGGAINMGSGDSLEGRAFSTVGLINIDGITAYLPIGCGSPVLTGPLAPDLASAACYTIFTSNGALDGSASSTSIGDVGSNGGGSVTGWTAGNVTGTLHVTQDPSTIQCAIDVSNLYDTLNAMIPDIELLYPVEFGNDLVLTPHVYLLNSGGAFGPATFTNSIYLNAQGNPNAVFVIKVIGGALTTSTYAKVNLINGAQAKNVFWMVDGVVSINNYSEFVGTIVVSVGAVNLVNTGVILDGRILTMNGLVTTAGLAASMPPGCGSVAPPVITTEPTNQTACSGSSVSFTVTATGADLAYQWRIGNVNLADGGNISGANTATLTINPASIADVASNYNVIVSGSVAPNDTSIDVSLTLNASTVVTLEPVNQTACIGGSVNFSVVASGTGLSYQWRKGNVNLIDGLNIDGATNDTLTIDPISLSDTSSFYNVIVTGGCGGDTSINVSLMLNVAPIITMEPINQTVCAGSAVDFSVAATGNGLTYQWRKGTVNLIDGLNIDGVTNDTLTIDPTSLSDTSSFYNVIVFDGCGLSDTSINVSLMLNVAPIITIEPINQTVCIGSAAGFSVAATGNGLTYQWRKGNINLIDGLNIDGATNDTLTIDPTSLSDTSSFYNVIVTGGCGGDTSINVSLMLNVAPIITIEPINQTVCIGSAAGFSVAATGNGLTYQWRKGNINLIDGLNIDGATNDTLIIDPTSLSDTSSFYNVIVFDGCGLSDTSINVSLMLNVAPVIPMEPISQTVCIGSAAGFSVAATGNGLTYQWRKGNINLIDGLNIDGATNDTLTIDPTSLSDTSSFYNVIVVDGCGFSDTSIFVSLMITQLPVAVASSNSPVCIGSAINLMAQPVLGATYSWTGVNGFISAVQNPTIPAATALDAGNYLLTVIANGCTSVPSTVSVIVNNCAANISVVKTVNNAQPLIGRNVIFTIVATNNGPSNATGVVVTDLLQTGYTFISSTTTEGTYNALTGIWNIGSLNNGASEVLTITALVNATGVYTNTASITANEIDIDIVDNVSTIETFPTDFNIPEGFSPNVDGINDLFVIRGILYYPNNTIVIYNRWGDKVFEASPYQNTWDGKTSMGLQVGGDKLPVGTYFYILDLGDGSDVIKGTIYLNW